MWVCCEGQDKTDVERAPKKIEQICLCLQDLLSANTQHLNISAAGTA